MYVSEALFADNLLVSNNSISADLTSYGGHLVNYHRLVLMSPRYNYNNTYKYKFGITILYPNSTILSIPVFKSDGNDANGQKVDVVFFLIPWTVYS